jgi:hypothetical protein
MTRRTPLAQRAQELAPEHLGLAVADHQPEHLASAVLGDAGGDDHGLGDDLVVHPGLAVGGVEVDVGEAGVVQVWDFSMTTMTVTHIGRPTILIEFGGWRLLTDPTFAPRRTGSSWAVEHVGDTEMLSGIVTGGAAS